MKPIPTMIIDDEKMDRYILKRTLARSSKIGQVFEAENGKLALDFMQDYANNKQKHLDEFPPLLIFLDINMHIMNGFEFLEHFSKLRKSCCCYHTIIFTMYTSSESNEDKQKASSYEFVKSYICKRHFSLETLEGMLQQQFTL